ncbi:MAG: hypothetical protein RBR45_15190 [Pseudomonas sp.]|jgi:hypothetical protein|nr:hypothetical protein [Pseudomonas sp.]
MKIEDLNPKARETFARSLVDIGVSIFRGLMIIITVTPVAAILKVVFDGEAEKFSILRFFASFTWDTYLAFILLLVIGFFVGDIFRKEGIRLLHEMEVKE